MARIALDARPLMKTQRTGVENVGWQYLKLLMQMPGQHAYYFYFTEPPKPNELPSFIHWRSYQWRAWLRLVVPFWLLLDRIDLVHFYQSYIPPLLRWVKAKKVVTVCDIMWLEDIFLIDAPSRRFILKGVLPSLRSRTDHYISISEATKTDLIEKLEISPERISVVLPYADEKWHPRANAKEALREIYGIDGNFLLFVGTAKPNKNIGRLLDAFSRLNKKHPDAQLIIAGFVLPFWDETRRILTGEPRVRWLQFVPEEHLPLLYSACTAFVSPSLNEGFGLPLLEAMACGAAVIAGNTGAQPEVVGDAGLLVNPYDLDAIVQAMEALWTDSAFRENLRRRALERAKTFTPQQTLQQLLEAYDKALR